MKRATPSTGRHGASGGGLKVFNTEIDPNSTPVIARSPCARTQELGQGLDFGQLGHRATSLFDDHIAGHRQLPGATWAAATSRSRRSRGRSACASRRRFGPSSSLASGVKCEQLLGRGQAPDRDRAHALGPLLGELAIDRRVDADRRPDKHPDDVGTLAGQSVQAPPSCGPGRCGTSRCWSAPVGHQQGPERIAARAQKRVSVGTVFHARWRHR